MSVGVVVGVAVAVHFGVAVHVGVEVTVGVGRTGAPGMLARNSILIPRSKSANSHPESANVSRKPPRRERVLCNIDPNSWP